MDLVLRTVFVFFLILPVTRSIGRRELSSMQPFDLILLVVMGDLVQQGVTQSDYSVTGLVLAAGTIALMQIAVSYLNFRFKRVRTVLDGEPIVLIEDGRAISVPLSFYPSLYYATPAQRAAFEISGGSVTCASQSNVAKSLVIAGNVCTGIVFLLSED